MATMTQTERRGPWATIDSGIANTTSPALTAHRPCPICGGLRSSTILELDQFQMYTDSETAPKEWGVRYVECSQCWAL